MAPFCRSLACSNLMASPATSSDACNQGTVEQVRVGVARDHHFQQHHQDGVRVGVVGRCALRVADQSI